MINSIDLQILGSEKSVMEMIYAIEKGLQEYNKKTTITNFTINAKSNIYDKNNKALLCVRCAGNYTVLSAEEIGQLTKEYGVIAEMYAQNRTNNTQEHIIADRGVMMVNTRLQLNAHELKAMSQDDLTELAEWEDISLEELKERSENGIYYSGGFDSFLKMNDLLPYLEFPPKEYFTYKDGFGDCVQVAIEMNTYYHDNNLYLGLIAFDEDIGGLDHYADITVNIDPLPYLLSTIDTNNNGDKMIRFLEKNGFGNQTSMQISNGWCTYPVFQFNEKKMWELFPEKMNEYAKLKGVEPAKKPLTERIKMAEEKTSAQRKPHQKKDLSKE